PIGYRRRPVEVSLGGGWTIEVPGPMAEAWDEDDEDLWTAWDGARTVWFKAFELSRDGQPGARDELLEIGCRTLPEGEPVGHAAGAVVGRGVLTVDEQEGKEVYSLRAFSAVTGQAAMCNVFYDDRADRDLALTIWRSLTCPAPTGRGK